MDTPWAAVSKSELRSLAKAIVCSTLPFVGKSTNKDEFVTAGGADLKDFSTRTFECKKIPGLFLAGEVLNVDGITGGYNFLNAWSTSHHAGKAIAEDANSLHTAAEASEVQQRPKAAKNRQGSDVRMSLRASTIQRRRATMPRMMAIRVGDQIIAGNDWNSSSPEYGIVRAQSYELQRVYYQGIEKDKAEIRRVDVGSLEAEAPDGCAGFTKYLVLYSKRYHEGTRPVIVRPEEVQLVSVGAEVADSAWLALPGLVWVALAYSIYQYGVEHGGIFAVFGSR